MLTYDIYNCPRRSDVIIFLHAGEDARVFAAYWLGVRMRAPLRCDAALFELQERQVADKP